MGRLEQLLEKQQRLEADILEERAKTEALKVLESVNGKVADAIRDAVKAANVDVKVLNGRFFQLTVAEDGVLTVAAVDKVKVGKANDGQPAGNGGNGGNGSQYQYFLKDGRGPYESIQDALDAMGVDKANRPTHNRWERLGEDYRDQIDRREKPAQTS